MRNGSNEQTGDSCDLETFLKQQVSLLKFIRKNIEQKDESDASAAKWNYVTVVIDRLLMLVFAIAIILSTVLILRERPDYKAIVAAIP